MDQIKFSIIKLSPNPLRGEIINIGILIYLSEGIDIRITDSQSKLKAIDNYLTLESLEELKDSLYYVADTVDSFEDMVSLFEGEICLTQPGFFTLSNLTHYETKVQQLMDRFINPIKRKSSGSRTRISTNLKDEFRNKGILGKSTDDLTEHKVISNFPISKSEGLNADFVLKNGIYHVTETLDLRTENIRVKHGESALKAITISKAKQLFSGELKSTVVYAVENISQETSAKHHLNLLKNEADLMFNLCSKDDMAEYFDYMLATAHQNLQTLN
jgi:hypothetical protein